MGEHRVLGDHQIVYLLRFLETLPRHAPGALEALLDQEIYCYTEVPYRLKPYAEIVADPQSTIVYDTELAARIGERVTAIGADGKLVRDRSERSTASTCSRSSWSPPSPSSPISSPAAASG